MKILKLFPIILLCIIGLTSKNFAQDDSSIQINSSEIVHFVVTAPNGNRTGADPRGAINPKRGNRYNEIEFANYATMSVGDIPNPGEEPEVSYSHEFIYVPTPPDDIGEYKIDVIGINSGEYEIYISVEAPNHDEINFKFKGSISSNEVHNFSFTYTDDPNTILYCKKVESISDYSTIATHSLWLRQNSEILSGNVGVNDIGEGPFLASQLELTVGRGCHTSASTTLKANQIKVKQNAVVDGNISYNELENNGTINGEQTSAIELPLLDTMPEFKTATPGEETIVMAQNEERILQPGSYGDVTVKLKGTLIFTGGVYHFNSFKAGDNTRLVFQDVSEIRIADKFESGQKSYIGPEDGASIDASDIAFFIAGVNGNNGKLGATPKAAKIGLTNTVFANFYAPNGTIWLKQNTEATGSFIGKDVQVGIAAKVALDAAWK